MGAVKKSTIKRRKKAKRTARILVVSGLILVILLVGSLFVIRQLNIISLRGKIDNQIKIQEGLIEANQQLRKELNRKNDLEYLEYLAREKLGMIKPEEEMYMIMRKEESED